MVAMPDIKNTAPPTRHVSKSPHEHAFQSVQVDGSSVSLESPASREAQPGQLIIHQSGLTKTPTRPVVEAVHVYEVGRPHAVLTLSAHNVSTPKALPSGLENLDYVVDFKNVKFKFDPNKKYVFVTELKFGTQEVKIKSAPIGGSDEAASTWGAGEASASTWGTDGVAAPRIVPAKSSTAPTPAAPVVNQAPQSPETEKPNSHLRFIASALGFTGFSQAEFAMAGEAMYDYAHDNAIGARFGALEQVMLSGNRMIPGEVADVAAQLGLGHIKEVSTDKVGNPVYTFEHGSLGMDKDYENITACTVRGVTLPEAIAPVIREHLLGKFLGQVAGDDGTVRYRFDNGNVSVKGDIEVTRNSVYPTRTLFDAAFRNGLGEYVKATSILGGGQEFDFQSGSIIVDAAGDIVSLNRGKEMLPGSIVTAGAGLGEYDQQTKDPKTGTTTFSFQYGDVQLKADGTIVDD